MTSRRPDWMKPDPARSQRVNQIGGGEGGGGEDASVGHHLSHMPAVIELSMSPEDTELHVLCSAGDCTCCAALATPRGGLACCPGTWPASAWGDECAGDVEGSLRSAGFASDGRPPQRRVVTWADLSDTGSPVLVAPRRLRGVRGRASRPLGRHDDRARPAVGRGERVRQASRRANVVAEELRMYRNTVRGCVREIGRHLGADLDDPTVRLNLRAPDHPRPSTQ